jgi:quinol-cytochrome oxidoreductase complex cytochrome b subunit
MWRVRKDGGLACVDQLSLAERAVPAPPVRTKTYSLLGITSGSSVHVETVIVDEDQQTAASSPNLTRRTALVIMATLAAVALLATFVPAPLEAPANPGVTPNPAKAPWYFLWLQELVTITTFSVAGRTINGALLGGIIIPGVLVLVLLAAPYLDKSPIRNVGIWWGRERRLQNWIFLAVVLAILILTIIGTFLRGPSWEFFWPWQSWPDVPRRI